MPQFVRRIFGARLLYPFGPQDFFYRGPEVAFDIVISIRQIGFRRAPLHHTSLEQLVDEARQFTFSISQ